MYIETRFAHPEQGGSDNVQRDLESSSLYKALLCFPAREGGGREWWVRAARVAVCCSLVYGNKTQ